MKTQDTTPYYPSKTYRISPFYYKLFYSILSIHKRDKLLNYFFKDHVEFKDGLDLPIYDKNELITMFIEQIYPFYNSKKLPTHLFFDNRLKDIIKIYNKLDDENIRVPFNVRISPSTINQISNLSKINSMSTIGEVIEMAITNYICNCPDSYYKLVKKVFEIENKE
ncbi:hypothetical protein [Gottfriedia solisilvae]|uniref:hypothetical protein n=1 Tax=Gottfriedia solisilvae TaxID=1516104 RepID=UPI003D2F23E0